MGTINMAAFMEHSRADGPGCRAVVWVQGCHKRCPGCGNPGMQPFVDRTVVSAGDLAQRILGTGDIVGVTFSGGEPFEQAEALAEVAREVTEVGMTVVAFSGYTLEELRARHDAAGLLARTDLLIDGPFIRELAGDHLWRGSSNQRLHYLSGRIWPVGQGDRTPRIHMAISPDMRVQVSGFPGEELGCAIEKALGLRVHSEAGQGGQNETVPSAAPTRPSRPRDRGHDGI